MHILLYFLLTLHVLVCLLMVFVVLMQRPRSEGLGAAFGGGMTENIFGAQTTNVLAKFTTWLGGIFFVLTLALAMVYVRVNHQKTGIEKELLAMPTPEAAAQPTPTPVGTLPAESAASTTPAPAATPEITEPAAATPVESPAPAAPTPDAATAVPLQPVPPSPAEPAPAETAPAAR